MLKGKLMYLGWGLEWYLIVEGGTTIDLQHVLMEAMVQLHGKRVTQNLGHDSYELVCDDASEYVFDHSSGLLNLVPGFGLRNVKAYLDTVLMQMNSQTIYVKTYGTGFKICADPEQVVNGVYFHGEGNFCEVPPGMERDVCKLGEPDCCCFVVVGALGFECAKFSSIGSNLLDRVTNPLYVSKSGNRRVGDCKVLGRKKVDGVDNLNSVCYDAF